MKKFLFTMMAALLVCGMSFAQVALQRSHNEVAGMVNDDAQLRSGWVGQTATQYVAPLASGKFAAFAPRVLAPDMSGQITKVKIGVCNWAGYNKGQMRIGLYPVPELTEDSQYTGGVYLDPTLGTEICGVDLDLTDAYPEQANYGNVAEVELPTALDIPDGDFWFVITAVDSICLLYKAGVGAANEMFYYADYTDQGYGWIFVDNSSSVGLCSLTLALYVEDAVPYQEQADLEVWFGDKKPGSSGINEIDEISIGEGDDLVIYPFFSNNGPDAITSSTCHVTLDVIIGGETINLLDENEDFSGDPFPTGYYFYYEAEGHVFGADQIALYEVTEFQVVAKAEGIENDPDETNNIDTLTVIITHPNPVQNLVATPEGANVVLTWEAPEPCEGLSLGGYKIYRDGAQVGMKPAGTETYTQNDVPDGTYEYCVVAVYNQTVLSEEVCVEATADGINEMAENIAVYPNPATTALKVANVEGANILVINSLGQVVANIENAKEMQEINVEGLAEGIYTVRIANETGVVTKQFCVKK